MKDRIKSKIKDYWERESKLKKTVDILGILICLAGIGTSLYMNFVNRSLWVDEASLAMSFSKRSIFELTNGVFERNQSAPVLYLYIVKIITLMFGNTEFTLRIFSVISYGLTLILSWYIAKHLFKIKYATLCSAFIANIGILLKYSNMFKQYMFECVIVLLVLLVYYLYKEKRLSLKGVIPCYMIFIWAANPACFMIGGVLAWEFISGIIDKDKKRVRNSIIIGIGVMVSFVSYYFYWLRDVANSEYMQDYWIEKAFPLIPQNMQDVKKALSLLFYIFKFGTSSRLFAAVMTVIIFVGFAGGLFYEKNRYVIITAIGFFVALFASWLRMFPMSNRLWLFAYPLFAFLAFKTIEYMVLCTQKAKKEKANTYTHLIETGSVCLMMILIISGDNMAKYWNKDNVYWPECEVNFSIAYVQEHIENGESVFVYSSSKGVTKYKIGYDTNTINGKNDIIWGSFVNNEYAVEKDLESIINAGRCYIIASRVSVGYFSQLLDTLSEKGELKLVQIMYDTPLYYFSCENENYK